MARRPSEASRRGRTGIPPRRPCEGRRGDPSLGTCDQGLARAGGAGWGVGLTRWLKQTKRGGGAVPPEERGDCVPASIASILGKPITAIRNTHGEGWWDRLQDECAKHGFALVH